MKHHNYTMTLFCLPFSGGNIYSYQKLKSTLPDHIRFVPLELPGHGRRLREPLLRDLDKMVDDMFRQIRDNLDEPYAIYGHSLGAMLVYLVAQKITQTQLPLPEHLFVSGHPGPAIPNMSKNVHLLPRDEFVKRVMSYGGIPQEVAAHQDLMDLFVPVMHADFAALSAYTHTTTAKLDIPLTVMIGTEEGILDEEALAWQDVTTRDITLEQFPGNHFFIFDHPTEITQLLVDTLERDDGEI